MITNRSGLVGQLGRGTVKHHHLQQGSISVATMNRSVKNKDRHPPTDSDRVRCVTRLVCQVQNIVDVSGDPEGFDATGWMSRWLNEPLPALGGVCPVDLLDTMEGQALVSNAIAQIQSGAYA